MNRLTFVLGVLVTACGGTEPAAPSGVESHDSAGIAIHTHGRAVLNRLTLSEALVTIGGGESSDAELYRVRGAVLLEDGGVAIANAGSSEILFFSPDGSVRERVGREGQGPEEFRNILWIQGTESDEVLVYDAGNQRLSAIGVDGTFRRTRTMRFEPDPELPRGAIAGPAFAFGASGVDRVVAVPAAVALLDGTEGPLPLRGELRVYGSELSDFTALDTVRLRTWQEVDASEGPPIGQVMESPELVFSANGRWTAFSEAMAHRVMVLRDGVPTYVVVEARTRTPFVPDSIPEHFVRAADSLPAYRAIQVDSEGRIWLRDPVEDTDGTSQWRVVSDGGRRIESLRLPESSDVMDARGARVLIRERDALDVERVVVRRVVEWPSNPTARPSA